jgi:purine nucleosidase/non-specific riboncleoside hydrolase
MPNRLILDTDGGVDDAQALLLLIGAGRPPDAITTVFGNVDLETATDNVLATLAVAGAKVPVHKGAALPLAQDIVDARHVHGEDGLGGAPRPAAIADIAGSDAVGFLVDELLSAAENGERVDLLTIGPLTNLAMALRLRPAITSGIGRLTIMGGTVYGRGNVTPAAEFNVFADPEAAAIVLRADIDTVVVPWEPCLTHFLDGAEVDRLFEAASDGPLKDFSWALARHARKTDIERGRGDCLRFIDPLAAAVVVEPGIVTGALQASVDVALAPGIARGMTIVDPSGRLGTPIVTIVEEARIERVVAMYAASIGFVGPLAARSE